MPHSRPRNRKGTDRFKRDPEDRLVEGFTMARLRGRHRGVLRSLALSLTPTLEISGSLSLVHVGYIPIEPGWVKIATGCADEHGFLVYVDGALAAVFARLDDETHGSHQGYWYLEAGFGRCSAPTSGLMFATSAEAEEWVLKQLPHSK